MKNLSSDVDNQVMQYKSRIQDLKAAFQGHAVLNTEIVVLRTEATVQVIQESLGERLIYICITSGIHLTGFYQSSMTCSTPKVLGITQKKSVS